LGAPVLQNHVFIEPHGLLFSALCGSAEKELGRAIASTLLVAQALEGPVVTFPWFFVTFLCRNDIYD